MLAAKDSHAMLTPRHGRIAHRLGGMTVTTKNGSRRGAVSCGRPQPCVALAANHGAGPTAGRCYHLFRAWSSGSNVAQNGPRWLQIPWTITPLVVRRREPAIAD